MPKHDPFFNEVSYWSSKLDEVRRDLAATKAFTLTESELSTEEKYELRELMLNVNAYTSLLADAVSWEADSRSKKSFWQRLLKK